MSTAEHRVPAPWLIQKLDEHSTQKYYIEHMNFRSNHMAHGIIAIARLGAGFDTVDRFIDRYSKISLEPPSHPGHSDESTDAEPATDDELRKILGERKSYYKIRNKVNLKLQACGTVENFIREEFPKLSRGFIGAALHGLIQTGYGYVAQSSTVVTEGLAYIHYSFLPLTFDENNPQNNISHFGNGETDILDVLAELRKDESLSSLMLEGADELLKSGWDMGIFGCRIGALMKHGDALMKYAYKIKVPAVQSCQDDDTLVVQISDWLVDQAIAVYALSETVNDFFVLHGVTASWALRQIVPLLKRSDALDALRTITCGVLAVYVAQKSPALTNKPEVNQDAITDVTWKEMIEKLLSSDRDEHVYKLVQVCHDRWLEKGKPESGSLYARAANLCIDTADFHANYNEQHSRKCNIRIHGLNEETNENLRATFIQRVKVTAGVNPVDRDIVAMHRLPGKSTPKLVLVQFVNSQGNIQ